MIEIQLMRSETTRRMSERTILFIDVIALHDGHEGGVTPLVVGQRAERQVAVTDDVAVETRRHLFNGRPE